MILRRALVLAAFTALPSACVVDSLGDGAPDGAALDGGALDGAASPDVAADPDASTAAAQFVQTPTAMWALPRGDGLPEPFSLPFPNDLARDAAGKVSFALFPHAGIHPLVAEYLHDFEGRLGGFSLSAAAYLRFGMPLDPSSLPADAAATTREGASLALIDVDPESPERGRRIPLQWLFREEATRYWPPMTLAVAPVFGFPMRPLTRYALVATRGLRGRDGVALTRSADLDAVLSDAPTDDAAVTAARALYAPALTTLAELGVRRDELLSLAVFTTDDPTAEFFRAAEWMQREGLRPNLVDLGEPIAGDGFVELRGHWGRHPNFQSGQNPYSAEGSGDFVLGPDGVPEVQRVEQIRFAITLPTTPMPEGGWPVAVYAHGTGGSYRSFINSGSAASLAREGVAVLGFDQVFHGERAAPGASPEAAFFNFTNPAAGRTNNRQAGLDLVQAGRFIRALTFELPGEGGATSTVRFNRERVFFFGHSQGGLNGPLWLAAEDGASAAVLSGAGGSFALAIILKTEPLNIPQLVSTALALRPGELTSLHPVVSLLQHLVDPSDPVNYGRYIVREPRGENHPKHVYQTQGFVDRYAPPPGIAALAMSQGLPLALPEIHPQSDYALLGIPTLMTPARANITTPRGAVTGAWEQFDAPPGNDGHFVVFDVPDARGRAAAFLGSAARDPEGSRRSARAGTGM
ncbi:MAG: hypothetical protein R3A52_04465 [Polyangiales bacterium]